MPLHDFNTSLNIAIDRAYEETMRQLRTKIASAAEDLHRRFEKEKYYNANGNLATLRKNDPKYDKWKNNNDKDPRRGHKDNVLQRSIGAKKNVTLNVEQGFVEHDIYRTMSSDVQEYAEHYIALKAPGLGALSGKLIEQAMISAGKTFKQLLEIEMAIQGWKVKIDLTVD